LKESGKTARGKYFFYPVAETGGRDQRKAVRVNHPVNFPTATKSSDTEEAIPPWRSRVTAVVAVAATYAYFLVFAQFGLLHAMGEAMGANHDWLRPVMAVMGGAGIAGSVAMGWAYHEQRRRGLMGAGFLVAGFAAVLVMVVRTPGAFLVVAGLTGGATGWVTVGLAAQLVRETGGRQLGLCLGIGTGLAYALCNLPPVFAAEAKTQVMVGLGAAAVGWRAVRAFEQPGEPEGATGFDYSVRGGILWILLFLALVAFDSAAFYLIQHTPELKAVTWTGGTQLGANAGAHLIAGLLAGFALSGRRVAGVALAATAGLLGAVVLMGRGMGPLGAPLYAAGVSAYSTLLVYYPARAGRVKWAVLVYAVAGWIGSALGIGLAEKLRNVPVAMMFVLGLLVVGLLGVRRRLMGGPRVQ
jgi:hypothetical protein